MKAYHIDRAGLLNLNDIISTTTSLNHVHLNDPETMSQLETFFPDGISQHGIRNFSSSAVSQNAGEITFETIYEYHRRLFFPKANSRFQSAFAVETLDDLIIWMDLMGVATNDGKTKVWEIDTLNSKVDSYDAKFMAGGSLINLEHISPLHVASWANLYWSRKFDEAPRKELLVKGSFKVIDVAPISLFK